LLLSKRRVTRRGGSGGEEALEKARHLPFRPWSSRNLVMPKLDGSDCSRRSGDAAVGPASSLTAQRQYRDRRGRHEAGAYDYLTKPVGCPRLKLLVEKALEQGATARGSRGAARQLPGRLGFPEP